MVWVHHSLSVHGKQSAGDPSSILGSVRSPGGGHGNPHQYSGLENPHPQRSQADFSLWGLRELDMSFTSIHQFFYNDDSSKLFLKYLFLCIYLGVPGLSCNMWDL